jgi:non-ribosomal peptide synthetase-like protein
MTEERAATLTHAPDEASTLLAEVLADVLGVERVPGDAHFFDDLGADSMVMARFCARVRKRTDLPDVSMKDVYRHPTLAGLLTTIAEPVPAAVEQPYPSAVPSTGGPVPTGAAGAAGAAQYILCGTVQLLFFLGSSCLAGLLIVWSFTWITAGTSLLDMYGRAVAFGAATLLGTSILPIAAKWLLVGRWKPCLIRVWSPAYVRFWIVRTLVRANPLLVVAGTRSRTSGSSLLYVLYLRALGAKVGRNVAVFSRNVPVCTDLITIGDGSVIRKDVVFSGYRALDGVIHTGLVTVGENVVVGETTVLDIGTAMGDGAQLGHASSLQTGQAVPAGEHWHGSPACPADVDYAAVEPAPCGTVRRATHAGVQLLTALLVYLPLGLGGTSIVLAEFPMLEGLLDTSGTAFLSGTFYREALVASAVVFVGGILVAFLGATAVPRLLDLAVRPDRVYALYGVHYAVHRMIGRLTNVRFFTLLFGDSSYVVHYLRGLGYDLSTVEQTGSNFGTEVRHESPFHVTVGRGTMVADGLSLMNAEFSNSSFRLSRTSIGAHSFLGNNIVYPPRSRAGDNCLLATKTLVPVDGPVRRDVGLLGSPGFEIPRTVDRDTALDPGRGEGLRRLGAKNRHNLCSMAMFLLVRWVHVLGLTLLVMGAADCYRLFGPAAVATELVAMAVFTMAWFVLVERAATGFRPLRPRTCSIYDRSFWRHERYWKLMIPPLDLALAGTPFKNVVSRLLGVRLGRMVFDDGCSWPERTLVTVGDRCTLNAGSVVQCHSQEDGAFKSDRTLVGGRCTLGVNAFVHYGVVIGDRAEIATDSFVMKGSEIPVGALWRGNPAAEASACARPMAWAARTRAGPAGLIG